MDRLSRIALALILIAAAGTTATQYPEGSTPERLAEINRDDLNLWRRLVREAGIPLE